MKIHVFSVRHPRCGHVSYHVTILERIHRESGPESMLSYFLRCCDGGAGGGGGGGGGGSLGGGVEEVVLFCFDMSRDWMFDSDWRGF